MFDLSPILHRFPTKYSVDGLLYIGALCWAGLLIHAYTSISWNTGALIIAFLLVLVLLGQLVLFLVVHKIWRLWQKQRSIDVPLAFRSIGGIIVQGYIRALVGELVLISAFALFHASPLTLLQLITISFTAISIITTLLTSQYWRYQEKGMTIFNVLCLGFGTQLFFLLLSKLL